MDRTGGHRRRRSRAGDHAFTAHTLPITPGRFVRREGHRRASERVRRSRGETHMTSGGPIVSPRPAIQPHAPTAHDRADPCTMVIFGALGDLSRRKLLPAIYQLMHEHFVDKEFAVLGVGRDDTMNDDTFRSHMRKALSMSDEVKGVDEELWQDLCRRLFFVSADLPNPADYANVGKRLAEIEIARRPEERNRLFYLAVPPSVF